MAALDLIAQAEHDPEARTFFVSPDPDLIERVSEALDRSAGGCRPSRDRRRGPPLHEGRAGARPRPGRRRRQRPRRRTPPDAAGRPRRRSCPHVRNAGAVFLGRWTAVPFGDYGVACNHVLPTAGTARFSSGLRASDYVTVSSFVQMDARRGDPVRAQHLGDREGRGTGGSRTRHGRSCGRHRSGGTVSPAAEPRPGVRDVEPYVSPQLDVAVRLNTNECPHPLPEAFADELAEVDPRSSPEPVPRWPDDAPARGARGPPRSPLRRNLDRERLERGAHRAAARLRRPRADAP